MTNPPRVHTRFETRRIDSLSCYENNARTHSHSQIEQLARSIREFGFTNPVLITEAGLLIAGHGRIEAARLIGMTEIPCVVVEGLTDAQRIALTLADNRIALNAGWDEEMIAREIAALNNLRFDISITGFSVDELEAFLSLEASDDPPLPERPPETPTTRLGDVWVLGEHRLICGDSTSIYVLDHLLDGDKADVCWTDPPYNVNYESTAGKIMNDDMDDAQFRDFLDAAFRAMFASLKPGASIYVAHSEIQGLNFRAAFAAAGFKLSSCLIWNKGRLVLGRMDYQYQHEPILYGWKPGAPHRSFWRQKANNAARLRGSDAVHPPGRWPIRRDWRRVHAGH